MVKIGKKKLNVYIKACEYALKNDGDVVIAARGNNIPRAIIVSDVVKKKHREITKDDVCIGCEDKDGKLVATIEINLKT